MTRLVVNVSAVGTIIEVADGVQTLTEGDRAEYVRVPLAGTSTYRVPASLSDEETLMLADILPTGYEVGVLNGNVRPGDLVAMVGAGPVGLAAIAGAQLFSPSHAVAIDVSDARLERPSTSAPTWS
jgi:alcohol dehydrogenase